MWISLLLSVAAALILIPVIRQVIYTIISKYRLKFYEQQGIPTHYSALMGQAAIFSKSHPENASRSCLEHVKKISNQADDKGILATNIAMKNGAVGLYIYNSDLVKEFLLKEDSLQKIRQIKLTDHNMLGLFLMDGEEMMKQKSLFMKIFRYEGIEGFVPRMCKIIQQCFEEFNQKHRIVNDKATKINLDDLFKPIMKRITNLLMFDTEVFEAESREERLHKLFEDFINLFGTMPKNPILLLWPSLAIKLGLTSRVRKLNNIADEQSRILEDILKERQLKSKLGECIIDRIAEHNKECKEKGKETEIMTKEEVMGNFNLFLLAGTDTSQNTTKMALCHMADKPELKAIVEIINNEIYGSEGQTTTAKMDSNETLTLWVKEALRMHSPVPRLSMRTAIKDITIGKYHVRNGDIVILLPSAMNFSDTHFKNPEQFDINRFKKDREKELPRYQYIPFSVGRRNCLGRYLGEAMVKLLVTQFCRTYTFEKPVDTEYYIDISFTLGVKEPLVNLTLK